VFKSSEGGQGIGQVARCDCAAFALALAMIEISVRSRISLETWEQVKTAYAAGVGLREIARKMKIPEGTVLARAKRERWTKQLQEAKAIALAAQSDAITPMQSVAVCMQERSQRYVARMADVTDKVLPHLQAMPPDQILDRADQLDRYDRVARRNYGLDKVASGPSSLNIAVLLPGGRTTLSPEQSTDAIGGIASEKAISQDQAH